MPDERASVAAAQLRQTVSHSGVPNIGGSSVGPSSSTPPGAHLAPSDPLESGKVSFDSSDRLSEGDLAPSVSDGASARAVDSRVVDSRAGDNRAGDNDRAAHDLAAVERVRAGDLEAFRELFNRYESRARAIAFGVVANRDDAEDVVQEAFLKAYRNISSFRGQSSFYTWFYRIVFNLSIDLSRKRYRKVESSLGESEAIDALRYQSENVSRGGGAAGDGRELVGHIDGPEEVVNRADIRRSISQALDGLSADHRAVIVLREIEGLSYNEISDVVGCSKGTVMSRLHHARRRMQKALTELLPWYEPSAAGGDRGVAASTELDADHEREDHEREDVQHEYEDAE